MGESPVQRDQEIAAVTHALDIGYRLLDTAENYGDGGAERIIGSALKAFGAARRSELFIVSKVIPNNATRNGISRACEASIQRMGCDYLDLYLLHWPAGGGPDRFTETLTGFGDLRRRGLIRHFGVSNFYEDDLRLWLKTEQRLGLSAATQCNQVTYSAEARGIEYGLLAWQRVHGIKTMAYSPLGRGSMTQHPLLAQLGRERGVSAAQIALAWCVREPDVVATPKSTNLLHLEQNLRAADLRLSPGELKQIDQAFPLRFRWVRQNSLLRQTRSAVRQLLRRRK